MRVKKCVAYLFLRPKERRCVLLTWGLFTSEEWEGPPRGAGDGPPLAFTPPCTVPGAICLWFSGWLLFYCHHLS